MYRRKSARAPRHIEESEAMRERDELKQSLAALSDRHEQLRAKLELREIDNQNLLDDKLRLSRELRELRTLLSFLQGEYTNSIGPGTEYGFKMLTKDWQPN